MKILFVCTANACRSPMAEGWARRLAPEGWVVGSAGLVPYPLSRRAVAVMAEAGVDISAHRPRSLGEAALDDWDLIVTLSPEAGRYLPALGSGQRHVHRPLADPMEAVGSPEDVRQAFRDARDQIGGLVREILAEVGRPA